MCDSNTSCRGFCQQATQSNKRFHAHVCVLLGPRAVCCAFGRLSREYEQRREGERCGAGDAGLVPEPADRLHAWGGGSKGRLHRAQLHQRVSSRDLGVLPLSCTHRSSLVGGKGVVVVGGLGSLRFPFAFPFPLPFWPHAGMAYGTCTREHPGDFRCVKPTSTLFWSWVKAIDTSSFCNSCSCMPGPLWRSFCSKQRDDPGPVYSAGAPEPCQGTRFPYCDQRVSGCLGSHGHLSLQVAGRVCAEAYVHPCTLMCFDGESRACLNGSLAVAIMSI